MTWQLTTEPVVLRPYFEGVSQRPHTLRWRAHRPDCRHATGEDTDTLATMVELGGVENARRLVIHKVINPCGVCKPDLLIEEPTRLSTITVLHIEPDGTGHIRQAPADGPQDAYTAVKALVGGGWLQQVQPSTDGFGPWSVMIDEEGKFKDMPANPIATMLAVRLGWDPGMGLGAVADHLVGPAVFVGSEGGRWHSLPAPALAEAREFYESVPATLHEETEDS